MVITVIVASAVTQVKLVVKIMVIQVIVDSNSNIHRNCS